MISYQWVHIRPKKPFIIIIKFQPMASAFDNFGLYYQVKIPRRFWCR